MVILVSITVCSLWAQGEKKTLYPQAAPTTAAAKTDEQVFKEADAAVKNVLKEMKKPLSEKDYVSRINHIHEILHNSGPLIASRILASNYNALEATHKNYIKAQSKKNEGKNAALDNIAIALGELANTADKSYQKQLLENEIKKQLKGMENYLEAITRSTDEYENKNSFGFMKDSYATIKRNFENLDSSAQQQAIASLRNISVSLKENRDLSRLKGISSSDIEALIKEIDYLSKIPVAPSIEKYKEYEATKALEEKKIIQQKSYVGSLQNTKIFVTNNALETINIGDNAKRNAYLIPVYLYKGGFLGFGGTPHLVSHSKSGERILDKAAGEGKAIEADVDAVRLDTEKHLFNDQVATILVPILPEESQDTLKDFKELYYSLNRSLSLAYQQGIKNIAIDCDHYKKDLDYIRVIVATFAQFIKAKPDAFTALHFSGSDAQIMQAYSIYWTHEIRNAKVTTWFKDIKERFKAISSESIAQKGLEAAGDIALMSPEVAASESKVVPVEQATVPVEPKPESSAAPVESAPIKLEPKGAGAPEGTQPPVEKEPVQSSEKTLWQRFKDFLNGTTPSAAELAYTQKKLSERISKEKKQTPQEPQPAPEKAGEQLPLPKPTGLEGVLPPKDKGAPAPESGQPQLPSIEEIEIIEASPELAIEGKELTKKTSGLTGKLQNFEAALAKLKQALRS